MWSPPSDTEIRALHSEGIDFLATCANAVSCSAELVDGPTPGAQILTTADSVRLVVPAPIDWFEDSLLWLFGMPDPIVGWPDDPLSFDLVYYRPPPDYEQRRRLVCSAQVLDESGALMTVTAQYRIVVRFDHTPGRDRVVEEVANASGRASR